VRKEKKNLQRSGRRTHAIRRRRRRKKKKKKKKKNKE
jgi:hypothetical protein